MEHSRRGTPAGEEMRNSDRYEHGRRPWLRSCAPGRRRRGKPVSRFFGSIGLFVRQVIAELRKVVRPTRNELVTYTSVVIVFVAVIMMFVSGLDTLFAKLVLWVFGG